MKLILLQDVKNIGRKGQVVEVNDGHARNFIIPRKLGKPATKNDIKAVEAQTEHQKELEAKKSDAYNVLMDELKNAEVKISAKANSTGTLFSALKEDQILEAVEKAVGKKVPNELLVYKDKIKEVGKSEVFFQFEKRKVGVSILVEAN